MYNDTSVRLLLGFEQVSTRHDWRKHFARQYQLCQWTMAAEARHPLFAAALQRIHAFFAAGRQANTSSVIKSTGPGIFTDAALDFLRERYGVRLGEGRLTTRRMRDVGLDLGDTLLLPERSFGMPAGEYQGADEVVYVRHAFAGTWKKQPNADLLAFAAAGYRNGIGGNTFAAPPFTQRFRGRAGEYGYALPPHLQAQARVARQSPPSAAKAEAKVKAAMVEAEAKARAKADANDKRR